MPYTADITRNNPTCFLFLIDQSKSMAEPMTGGGGKSKAEAVAEAINSLLYNLCLSCVKGQLVLDRLQVGVLGYGSAVGPALGGALAGRELVPVSAVACNPLRVEQRPGPGGAPVRAPVWFDSVAQGKTPLCSALWRAAEVVGTFLTDHPRCFPPVVINLTDGQATDGDPDAPAFSLTLLESDDGNVLLFNAHLSSCDGRRVLFPDDAAGLDDPFARLLFQMSSVLPPPLREQARQAGYPVTSATRGFAFNADLGAVVQLLDIGTKPAGVRR